MRFSARRGAAPEIQMQNFRAHTPQAVPRTPVGVFEIHPVAGKKYFKIRRGFHMDGRFRHGPVFFQNAWLFQGGVHIQRSRRAQGAYRTHASRARRPRGFASNPERAGETPRFSLSSPTDDVRDATLLDASWAASVSELRFTDFSRAKPLFIHGRALL